MVSQRMTQRMEKDAESDRSSLQSLVGDGDRDFFPHVQPGESR
jgi:hypothetical protein